MDREGLSRQVEEVAAPMLVSRERVSGLGPVWAVEKRGHVPLLLRARDPYLIAVTDQRLMLFQAPRRSRRLGASDLVLAKRWPTFSVVHVRRAAPLLQIRLRAESGKVLVLEFRPRDRGIARQILDALGYVPRGRVKAPRALLPGPPLPGKPGGASGAAGAGANGTDNPAAR